jgi:hypothetical protein
MRYRSAFTTLSAVVRQLELGEDTDNSMTTAVDNLISTKYANQTQRIVDIIYAVSEELHQVCAYTFAPYEHEYSLRLSAVAANRMIGQYNGSYRLLLSRFEQPALDVSALSWAGDSRTQNTDYVVGDGLLSPAEYIELDPTQSWAHNYPSFSDSLVMTGLWGYHEAPDRLYVSTGATIAGDINASVTSFDVDDGTLVDVLQYIKIGDEVMQTTAISTNTLTVERGVLGSTAASHTTGDAVQRMDILPAAESAARRLSVARFLNPSETRRIVPLPDGTVQQGKKKTLQP